MTNVTIIRVGLVYVFELYGLTILTRQGLNDGYFFVGFKTTPRWHSFHFLLCVGVWYFVFFPNIHTFIKNISLINLTAYMKYQFDVCSFIPSGLEMIPSITNEQIVAALNLTFHPSTLSIADMK